jgi:hypothetical protein
MGITLTFSKTTRLPECWRDEREPKQENQNDVLDHIQILVLSFDHYSHPLAAFGKISSLGSLIRVADHSSVSIQADNRITFLARINFRGDRRIFGIRQADRRAHMYVIGKTGTGKSTLLETLIGQDVENGEGLALLDPHGDLVERVLARIPDHRKRDLISFDVPDLAHPLGFNPLERVPPAKRALAASGLLEVFKKIWAENWGPRLEHILRNALLALLDQPESTLADVLRLLDDRAFRQLAAGRVANAQVRDFWLREYESYPRNFRAEAIAPIQNKVGAFLAHPVLHRIVTQPKSSFDLRRVMDGSKILLVNLAKGKIGEDAASLLGAMVVSRIGLAALGRASRPLAARICLKPSVGTSMCTSTSSTASRPCTWRTCSRSSASTG